MASRRRNVAAQLRPNARERMAERLTQRVKQKVGPRLAPGALEARQEPPGGLMCRGLSRRRLGPGRGGPAATAHGD